MQKALELFERIEDFDENPYHKTRTIIFNRDDMAFIKEAIAELEALQSRSCDGCKFHDDVGWDDWCCDCIRKWTIDRYEAKEQLDELE